MPLRLLLTLQESIDAMSGTIDGARPWRLNRMEGHLFDPFLSWLMASVGELPIGQLSGPNR
jgi:hypothetical protein